MARAVQRGQATAEIVVVHGGEIIMDEGVAMHAFKRRAHPQRTFGRHAEQARCFDHEEGPQPLAGCQSGIAHGRQKARNLARLLVEKAVKKVLCRRGGRRQSLGKVHWLG